MTDILMSPIRLNELEILIQNSVRRALNEKKKTIQPVTNPNRKLSIEQLIDYLPEHPAKQTVYGWCSNRKIPFQKHGSRVFFVQSDIDNWLDSGRQISHLKEGY